MSQRAAMDRVFPARTAELANVLRRTLKTPKYAAIDIIMWLTLTDPDVLALKPGTLVVHILDGDENHIGSCWKCLTIIGMTQAMHGYPREALEDFQKAVNVVKRDTGSVPTWLTSRVDLAAAEAAKENR